jgi:anti-anti-sigma factor
MTIGESIVGSVTVLALQGRLDAMSAQDTTRSLSDCVEKGIRQLALDLSGIEYVSSAGLRALLTVAKQMQKAQGRMVLAAPSDQAGQVLEMAGFSGIMSVFPTTAAAIASFRSAKESAAGKEPLALHLDCAEELYLLALDETHGAIRTVPGFALEYALAGALLMDLALLDRIESDLSTLTLSDHHRTGDPLLDDTILEFGIRDLKTPQPVAYWLDALADRSRHLQKRVLDGLCEKGILKEQEKRILWVFASRRYPIADNREVEEVHGRLRALILGDAIPDPRDVVLINLGNACKLLEGLFTPEEYERALPRIEALARLDLIGQAMTKAIADIESRIAQTMAVMGH